MASVVIVGAGPAGTGAAIELARSGNDVVVIDKATFPRDKCCGDGLTSAALRHLDDLGLDPTNIASWKPITDIEIRRPSGAPMSLRLPSGPGWFAATAERAELDMALVDLARANGADIREGVALDGLDLFDDRIVVRTAGSPGVEQNGAAESFEADWLIAADGMWSRTRKLLGLRSDKYLGEWHAMRHYWSNVSERASSNLFIWFEPDVLPGYVWSFPLANNRANVGFGVLRSTHKTRDMGRLWSDILDRPHIRQVLGPDASAESSPSAWPIPARIGRLPMTAHRTFVVGDAAGACDPMTGEGIGQALQTGVTAAEVISKSLSPAEAAIEYERRIAAELGVDMAFAATLGGVLKHKTWTEWTLKTTAMTDWTSRNFVRWLFEDYPRAVLGTPRRWSRSMFSKPGAFIDS